MSLKKFYGQHVNAPLGALEKVFSPWFFGLKKQASLFFVLLFDVSVLSIRSCFLFVIRPTPVCRIWLLILNQQFSIEISKEGLHKKFSGEGVMFLKELVKFQLSQQFLLQTDTELKKHFAAINIKDSSKFSLPSIYNADYPGFGNFSKTNGLMNLQTEPCTTWLPGINK